MLIRYLVKLFINLSFVCIVELSGRGADVSGEEFHSRKLVNKLVQQLHVSNRGTTS